MIVEISEIDLDVWKAAIIAKIRAEKPQNDGLSRIGDYSLTMFFVLILSYAYVMLLVAHCKLWWYANVLVLAAVLWFLSVVLMRRYCRRRVCREKIRYVLQFELEDVNQSNQPEIEFYERTYDVYITPERKALAVVREREYERRMSATRYEALKKKIREERILRLSKMMRAK